jgi:hypothetical protein
MLTLSPGANGEPNNIQLKDDANAAGDVITH